MKGEHSSLDIDIVNEIIEVMGLVKVKYQSGVESDESGVRELLLREHLVRMTKMHAV